MCSEEKNVVWKRIESMELLFSCQYHLDIRTNLDCGSAEILYRGEISYKMSVEINNLSDI